MANNEITAKPEVTQTNELPRVSAGTSNEIQQGFENFNSIRGKTNDLPSQFGNLELFDSSATQANANNNETAVIDDRARKEPKEAQEPTESKEPKDTSTRKPSGESLGAPPRPEGEPQKEDSPKPVPGEEEKVGEPRGSESGSSEAGARELPFLERKFNNVINSLEKLVDPPKEESGDRSGSTRI